MKTILKSLTHYFPALCSFGLVFILLRGYEYLLSTANHITPDGFIWLMVQGIFLDLLIVAIIGLILWPVFFLCTRFNRLLGYALFYSITGVILLVNIALLQYYGEVFVLLGSDFFGYNVLELSDTVNTSITINFARILPFLLFPLLLISFHLFLRHITPERTTAIGVLIYLLAGTAGWFLTYPTTDQFSDEVSYNVVVNKGAHFYRQSKSYLLSDWSGRESFDYYEGPEYPLLREAPGEDVLAPYLDVAESPPNIVLILVEGLGGTFMGENAMYPGFTPFLDSLSQQSLFWPNFLAMSGRSFAAVPSITASLPYGRRGFMEYGFAMPYHYSLISLLRHNSYYTSFYAGYSAGFDNLDIYLERQGTDFLLDASHFGDEFRKMDEIEGGFTWGYADHDLFTRAFDFVDNHPPDHPRLDMFFTLNFHEPFIIPDQQQYIGKVRDRLKDGAFTERMQEVVHNYEEIFAALLYTDHAIEQLIRQYRERADYENTVFIITGDHRIAPIPHKSRLDRFHVPFIIYSPLVREPATFRSVSTHMNVTPTILGHLHHSYGLDLPERVHWVGEPIDMEKEFRSIHTIPFIRNKNEMMDYMKKEYFLSGNQLFRIDHTMYLQPVDDRAHRDLLMDEFAEFRSVNHHVMTNDKLIPVDTRFVAAPEDLAADEAFLQSENLMHLEVEELFELARERAYIEEYDHARIILARALQLAPNYHDARVLKGRTYGWEGRYAEADSLYLDVINRNDRYIDAYVARVDLYFWQRMNSRAVAIASEGLDKAPDDRDLLAGKARSLYMLGNETRAREIFEELERSAPDNERVIGLRRMLQ